MYGHMTDTNDRWIARWLTLCAVVIFGMILLGGVTRLTDSGLSMVEWSPIMGAIPPLSEQDWITAFEKYKLYPEYLKINYEMDLAGFKVIFMYEYLHRVLGRLIGLLYFVPLVFFIMRGMVKRGLTVKLLALFVMGGCQGLLGWYMVKSGLVDRPDVSQYRLTAQFGSCDRGLRLYGLVNYRFDVSAPRSATDSKLAVAMARGPRLPHDSVGGLCCRHRCRLLLPHVAANGGQLPAAGALCRWLDFCFRAGNHDSI